MAVGCRTWGSVRSSCWFVSGCLCQCQCVLVSNPHRLPFPSISKTNKTSKLQGRSGVAICFRMARQGGQKKREALTWPHPALQE